jgi:RND family efflux transporter MFP subunit
MNPRFRWLAAVVATAGAATLLTPTTDGVAQSRIVNARVPDDAGTRAPAPPSGTGAKSAGSTQDGACLIQPSSVIDLAASAAGVLSEVHVERGHRVKQGQVLAVLDHDVERAMFDAAKARTRARAAIAAAAATRDMARQKLERMRALKELSYGAQLELELADGEFKVASHRLQQAREAAEIAERDQTVARQQLAQREVRSPIDGIVADRLLEPGERVDGRAIFRLMNLDELRVELVLPAERFGDLRPGMAVSVEPVVGDSGPVAAQVTQVDDFIDAASATFRARLSLANAERRIPAGARCRLGALPGGDDGSAKRGG